MISTVKCPSCQANLRVPAESAGVEYTCPRCLGVVALAREPGESPGIQAVPPIPPVPATPPPLPVRAATCPSCGKPVQDVWLFCPYCEEPLKESRSLRRESSVDRDVRRDSHAQLPAHVSKHAKRERHFLFGEEIHLQVDVRALIGLSREPVLAIEDEQGEKDRFQTHDRREQ